MDHSPYGYAAEKFNAARHNLMLPHPRGEPESIVGSFHECALGLHDIRPEQLDDSARDWVRKLEDLMDDDGISDPRGLGTWQLKAEKLTEDEKFTLSRVVDELAHWFSSRARGER